MDIKVLLIGIAIILLLIGIYLRLSLKKMERDPNMQRILKKVEMERAEYNKVKEEI